jgi:hypothetical protein
MRLVFRKKQIFPSLRLYFASERWLLDFLMNLGVFDFGVLVSVVGVSGLNFHV